MKSKVKKLEKETIKETFECIQNSIPHNKKAYYDGRQVNVSAYTFGDYASDILEWLKDKEYREKFFRTKSNVKKIKMAVEGSRHAYALTYRLPDKYVVQKEMLSIIEKMPAGGHMIKLGDNEQSVCPNCGAILEDQDKFDKNNKAHICENCGQALIDPSKKNNLINKNIVWICDKCGDCLNNQKNFTDRKGTWKCKKCGTKNIVQKDTIKQ